MENDHPEEIYFAPENQQIYFIKKTTLKHLHFPRLNGLNSNKKKYKWKKMNFTTNLPKHNPIVRYICGNKNKNY